MEKKKYCVTITRTGCLFIEAEDEAEAMYIADHQTTDAVNWSDDWGRYTLKKQMVSLKMKNLSQNVLLNKRIIL